jgi:5-methylcytosine-specific restriction enzyme A
MVHDNLSAKDVIEAALPDATDRWVVMDRLIRSWEFAASIAPAAPSLTLRPDGFRMNVGQVEALTFFDDAIRILLAASSDDTRLVSLPVTGAEYLSFRGPQSVFGGTAAEYRADKAVIDPLHEAFMRIAATTINDSPRRGSPYKAWHSSELVKYAAKYASASNPAQKRDGQRAEYMLSEEVDDENGTVIEGARKSILVNIYERDPNARLKCIAHWGPICQVCHFDFAAVYGDDLGRDFIHVHHLKPLHEIAKAYVLNPIEDLRPVCPNCHAMLHRRHPALKIEKLREIIGKRQRGGT